MILHNSLILFDLVSHLFLDYLPNEEITRNLDINYVISKVHVMESLFGSAILTKCLQN